MEVLKPTSFTSAMLVSSTATDGYPTWDSGTTYTTGQIVVYNGRLYESIHPTGHNNNQPDISPTYWVDIGPSNRFAMFDRTVTYGTSATTTMTVVIATGIIDSIALIGLQADIATITVRDGLSGPIVFEKVIGLLDTSVTDWYQYFLSSPLLKRTQVIVSDIPPYSNAHVTLTLTSAISSEVKIGEFIFGTLTEIGGTQYGASAGIIDYSRKETDEFGNVVFVERPFSKRVNASVFVENFRLNRVQQTMYSLRATPAVWVFSDSPELEEAMVVYGFYRDFSTDIAYPAHSIMSLEIEGLT